eukprot:1748980-Rhodomonas_salina.6
MEADLRRPFGDLAAGMSRRACQAPSKAGPMSELDIATRQPSPGSAMPPSQSQWYYACRG